MATICFDFGNTRLKYAVFEQGNLKEENVLENDDPSTIEKLLTSVAPEKTILSSVIAHNPAIEPVLAAHSQFHKLSYDSILPFTSPVGRPSSIGADRLALCAAAVNLFPGKNNLAIGLGTCITYNFINKKKEFIGGSISPGMDMRFRSLHTFTARLPLLKEEWNFPLMGYDTATNILSGVLLGMAKEIDGFIDAYGEKYGNYNVLLTGGNALYFVPHLKNRIFADPDLIFKGLYAISECN
ncbi:MAG: type III pantothenate kinase [Chitinophagaceae bacterium]|nr:type III pantothenate kinase [Chitinophagaceae bacterium]